MKKLTMIIVSLLVITTTVFTVYAQQKDKGSNGNKGKGKEQHAQKDKGNKQDKKDDSRGNSDKSKDDKADKRNNDDNGNGKGKNKDKDHDDEGDGRGRDKNKMKDGYKWDRETFKDRKQYRNQDKVTICHKINRNDEPPVTIRVSENALKAHLNHGDVQGDCPAVSNNRFSDAFLKRRTQYYTTLQDGQEQVVYSRSILDYALERLTGARSQLVVLQRNNAPQAEIDRKQAVVVELEQNVSLLETLVGVAANLLVNKITN